MDKLERIKLQIETLEKVDVCPMNPIIADILTDMLALIEEKKEIGFTE